MSELIERIAQAINSAAHDRRIWHDLPENRREDWRRMARAAIAEYRAIEARRTPNKEEGAET